MSIKTDFYLTNFGFVFDAEEYGRDEVELHIQTKFQGTRPGGKDYIFQANRYPKNEWLVNGTSIWGARACAAVCRGMNARPVRIDVTMAVSALAIDYDLTVSALKQWFAKNKPTTTVEEFTGGNNLRRAVFGTRKSRFSLIVQDRGGSPDGDWIEITWNIRQDKVEPAWKWLEFVYAGSDYYDACRNTFAACTNSILEPDFFGLRLPYDPRLEVTKKADVKEDYWGWLGGVASKIKSEARKQKSDFLIVESVRFLERELGKMIERDIREANEKQIRDRQYQETAV